MMEGTEQDEVSSMEQTKAKCKSIHCFNMEGTEQDEVSSMEQTKAKCKSIH
jgi:hypothetical protein